MSGCPTSSGRDAISLNDRRQRPGRPHCPAYDDGEHKADNLPVIGFNSQARASRRGRHVPDLLRSISWERQIEGLSNPCVCKGSVCGRQTLHIRGSRLVVRGECLWSRSGNWLPTPLKVNVYGFQAILSVSKQHAVYVFSVNTFTPFNSLRSYIPYLVRVTADKGACPWSDRCNSMVL
jgi:hypothetical protein